ncbi:MAG: hypothetical protein ACK4Z5_07840 [Brevundimonas sp.]
MPTIELHRSLGVVLRRATLSEPRVNGGSVKLILDLADVPRLPVEIGVKLRPLARIEVVFRSLVQALILAALVSQSLGDVEQSFGVFE